MSTDLSLSTVTKVCSKNKNYSISEIYHRNADGVVIFKVFALNKDGSGFIICSTTQHLPPVIGYDVGNRFSYDTNNTSLEKYFESIDELYEHNLKCDIKYKESYNNIDKFKMKDRGDTSQNAALKYPIMSTHWGQGAPYNLKTPGLTGCVPTAAAQVMKYHNHPYKGTGIIPAYKDGSMYMPAIDISEYIYQWDKMKDDGGNTYEEQSAVADLMLHLGCAVRAGYGVDSTIASFEGMGESLTKFFGYDDFSYTDRTNLSSAIYSSYSRIELESIFNNDLLYGKPIIVGGAYHCIVCDGSDENGLFHLNYGWEGSSDGYYDIFTSKYCESFLSDIKPKQDVNIILNAIHYDKDIHMGEQKHVIATVHNDSSLCFNGRIALALCDANDAVIFILSERELKLAENEESSITFDFIASDSWSLGKRKLRVLTLEEGERYGWKKLTNYDSQDDGIVNIKKPETNISVKLSESLKTDLLLAPGDKYLYPITVVNEAEDDQNYTLTLVFIDKNENVTYQLAQIKDVTVSIVPNDLVFDVDLPKDVKLGINYNMMVLITDENIGSINSQQFLTGNRTDVCNRADVKFKRVFEYYDDVKLLVAPDYPKEIDANTKTLEATISFADQVKVANLDISLIDDYGNYRQISNKREYVSAGQDPIVTYKFDISLALGEVEAKYNIGIFVVGLYGIPAQRFLITPQDDSIKNPVEIVVKPINMLENLKLAESLMTKMHLKLSQRFSLPVLITTTPNNDPNNNIFVGTLYACMIMPDGNEYILGRTENAVGTNFVSSWHIDCLVPGNLSQRTGVIVIKGAENGRPDILGTLPGMFDTFNTSINVDISE